MMAGAPMGNTNREIYTLEVALDLFEKAKDILVSDASIVTETELMVKCKYALSLPMSSYQYLRDEKFPIELGDHKKEINSILESRVMKCKEMYPGIAAMTLKNKHRWKDQHDVKVGMDEETLSTILNALPEQDRIAVKAALLKHVK